MVNVNAALAGPEIAYIVEDADVKLLFADQTIKDQLIAAIESTGSKDRSPKIAVWMNVEAGTQMAGIPSEGRGWRSYAYDQCFPSGDVKDWVVDKEAPSARTARFSVEDGFHMYYTSGTTGHPKGVILSHKIVVLHAVATIKGSL